MAHGNDKAWVSASRETVNVIVSLALMGVAVAFLTGALQLDFGNVRTPGPGMFPTLAAGLATILTAVMAWRGIWSLRQDNGERVGLGHRNSTFAAVLLAVMAVLFEPLGATLSAFAFVAALAIAFTDRRRWWAGVLFAVGITAAILFIFQHLLELPLPPGLLHLF